MRYSAHYTSGATVSLLVLMTACAPVGVGQDSAVTPLGAALEGASQIDGFFRFHQQEDNKLFLELAPEQLGQEFGLLMHFKQGVRGLPVSAGHPVFRDFSETRLMRFRRVGDRVQLVHENPRFTAEPGSPARRSAESNTGHAIAASFEIESQDAETGRLLVDLTDFLVSDYGDIDQRLRGLYGNTPVDLDRSRSHVARVQAFPENVEIDVELTYGTSRAPSRPIHGLADPRSISVGVRYSVFALPDEPMQPRLADARVGHLVTAVMDLSRDRETTPFLRYVNRWRLEKQDHSMPVSEPVAPIVIYIDHSVPHEYRRYVREGIEAWNKAFEAAGYRKAVVARDAPEDSGWSPEDARYSTVRWVAGSVGGAGPSQVDPRTGEILKSTSLVGLPIWGFGDERWLRLIEGEGAVEAAASALHGGTHLCHAQFGLAPQLGFQHAALTAFDLIEAGDPMPDEFFGDALRWLVMHEVGHNLGLFHNFRSASAIPYERLHDRAFTREHGIAASVMDYTPPNIALDPSEQGYYWPPEVGAYDVWAIQYAYAPVYEQDPDEAFATRGTLVVGTEAELIGLHKITDRSTEPLLAYDGLHIIERIDPRTSRMSLSDDPLRFAADRLILANRIEERLDRLIAPGEGYESLREAWGTLRWIREVAFAPALMTVGGLYVERDHKDTPGARPPFTIIPAAEQRRALQFIIDHAFAPGALPHSAGITDKFVANRWEHWGMPSTMRQAAPPPTLDFPIHDEVLGFQRQLLTHLFDPYRLARIVDNETRVATGEEVFTLPELFETLSGAIWSELEGGESIDSYRRNLQRAHLETLSELTLNEEMDSPYWAYPPRRVPSDARALARWELGRLLPRIERALNDTIRTDTYTRAHLTESKERIHQVLTASIGVSGGGH